MEINKVLIIGAGTMGRGIAQWFAQQGVIVELTDAVSEMAIKSQKMIADSLNTLKAKGKFTEAQVTATLNNLKVVDLENYSTDSDLVIEAIIEDLKIKTDLFLKLDKTMSKHTVLASNTSSIPITTLARNLSKGRQEKTLGLHFFNPATIMKLVEIIETPWSSKELANNLKTWFAAQGKKPAICKDYPGFIVNRVARNFYGEAFQVLESYDQDKIKEIDEVMTEVGGFKMGPFTLMDLIGIDINYDVTCSVWNSYYNDPRFRPHRVQREMVDSGRIGKKVGKGFYSYDK
ncbi:3-hydroxyacyl-CoA dehydrogenase NAD-binding domain-containing protein [Bacteriovorax sp. Seq25_V]|uniref:3-hydroxyacyl-CoA dehydrogenase NAD-binding domain-containing protein n=1 Tax=Bacteriovorax sp. Seq25_V TaxID=1201288 RepID=UPI00038A3CB3|nr:3-hydroxyacyl-CoA dehydrogenase NAD-binding domain-containing protein [Bacteriovorax sp. Seq25_V]EQC43822.1 3-hydroxyacyl-CoA dehydrogenase, NAD binding domain protein [Bacteriovorax sp. Seq25_V]